MAVVVMVLVALLGCGAAETPSPEAEPTVALPADGERYDPPADTSEVPEGAWICDMGTVHYARPDKGDGSCPVCGMELVHHTP